MKVLLVNGSPHKEGSTYTALCAVSGALNQNGIDTDVFWIGTRPLAGCTACYKCTDLNRCVFQDTVNEFLNLAGDYDGFVFGTPVHWGGASGAIASFLDRAFYADLNTVGRRDFRPQGGHNRRLGSDGQVFWPDADAYYHVPLLEHGARDHSGRSPAGRGGAADDGSAGT